METRGKVWLGEEGCRGKEPMGGWSCRALLNLPGLMAVVCLWPSPQSNRSAPRPSAARGSRTAFAARVHQYVLASVQPVVFCHQCANILWI